MKTLIIDWGNRDTYFYIEDEKDFTLRKSSSFKGEVGEVVSESLTLAIANHVNRIKIDKTSLGLAISEDIKKGLSVLNITDIEILEYERKPF